MKGNNKILVALLCTWVLVLACAKEKKPVTTVAAEQSIISAHTSGMISRESTIRIRFVNDTADSGQINVPLTRSAIEFEPKIKGVTIWTDSRTLEFRPEKRLPAGQKYIAIVKLPELLATAKKSDRFVFEFSTMQQSFELTLDGLQAMNEQDLKNQQLSGLITTADVEYAADVEKMLVAKQAGTELGIRWSHASNQREHSFVIDNIMRGDDSSSVVIQCDGKPINVARTVSRKITVASLSSFAVSSARAIQGEEQCVEIRFTDPLEQQNLYGLIRINDEQRNLRFNIERSIVRVYSAARWAGQVNVQVQSGIRNVMNQRLSQPKMMTIHFEEIKPQVRFAGTSVIIPTTQGLTIPIEAVNLRSVVVEAMRVFEKNMPQFLQVNQLEDSNELYRVGSVVWKKTVSLDLTPDRINRWVRYGLNVEPLIQEGPGGLYRLKLSFGRQQIVYHCADEASAPTEEPEMLLDAVTQEEGESSYWDAYEENEDWEEYYQERMNPCHPAYYMKYHDHDITIYRNVLISDIGLVAKRGSNDSVLVAATDIKTAQPLPGVVIKLLDFQQQVLSTGNTDDQGMVALAAARTPFLIVAQANNQAGYLKLDDGSALPVSHFDVAGETIQKGIKGFIYGERGVWRPGDPLYLTFILMDNDNRIPANHPVKFELINPRGQLVKTITRTKSTNGFYNFETGTDPDAPTGNWTARVKIGGVTFEKILKIETVMPNRIKVKLDFGKELTSLAGGQITTDIIAAWLHGAPAKNLKSDIEVTLTSTKTSFAKYEDYIFDDPARIYEPESQMLFDGKLDETGKASVVATVQTEHLAPGMLMANFKTRVFEAGGAASVDRFDMPYHPYDRYIGIRVPKGDVARGMLLTDTTHTVALVAVDNQGKPKTGSRIEVKIYQINWRWWWEKEPESIADYIESSSYRQLKADTVRLANGMGSWQFKITYPSWGRYLIRARDLDGNHTTGKIVYIDWPGWAGRAQKDLPGGANVLTFAAEKSEYQVGEQVVLTIPTGKQGRALVSVETGTRVILNRWLEAGEQPSRFEFRATAAMAPNVYVGVTFLQPHLQAGNDLPIRMYGVIPIKVVNPATQLSPQIAAADVFVPEETVQIDVSEANGKPMTYTLALVDEGLLDLTRFRTPDPWNHFYKKEALGVKTWDLFDMIAGAYGGQLEQLLAIGGGDEGGLEGQKRANRFPPMVRYLGPFDLAGKATNTHRIDMPPYVGSVRLMVVAGRDGAFGSAEKAVFVRKPLMLLATLPRVLGPEEEVELPVSVFALEKNIRNVTVSVATDGPLSVEGPAQKQISFSDIGDELVSFTLQVASQAGVGSATVKAVSGKQVAQQKIEIDIRMPGGPVVDVVDTLLAQNGTWNRPITLPGMAGTNKVSLEVTRIPPLNLEKRLGFLIQYPHGCVEQTTSSVFPQLFVDKLIELPQDKRSEIEKNVKAGIERLRTFQTSSGGFAYWPGNIEADEWSSNYAGHFLLEAQKLGYSIPPGLVNQWKKYQRSRALSWTTGLERSELIQAYRVYTLALAADAELSAMNRLRESGQLPTTAQWQLAAAYQMAGQPEVAQQLTRDASYVIAKYNELSNTYGSDLRDKAMILQALLLMKEMKKIMPLVKELSEELCSNKWLSTQSTAYALMAMANFAYLGGEAGEINFACSWDGGQKKNYSTTFPIYQLPLPVGQNLTGIVDIQNTSKSILYPRLILEGIPKIGTEQAAQNNMAITVKYLTLEGKPLDPYVLEQGTDFVAEVTVLNTGRSGIYEEVALSHIFPSGWEIHNERMDPTARRSIAKFDYQDIRDDRVYTYFDIDQGESKTFRVLLNASYLGKFYLPLVHVEAMYDATINARVPGRWVSVVKPGSREF